MGRPYNNTIPYNTIHYNTIQYNVRWAALTITLCCLAAQYTAAAAKASVNTFYDGAPYPSAGKKVLLTLVILYGAENQYLNGILYYCHEY